jgi:hypothetical protein
VWPSTRSALGNIQADFGGLCRSNDYHRAKDTIIWSSIEGFTQNLVSIDDFFGILVPKTPCKKCAQASPQSKFSMHIHHKHIHGLPKSGSRKWKVGPPLMLSRQETRQKITIFGPGAEGKSQTSL